MSAAPACDCKVGRVSRKYGLDGAGEELASRWRSTDGESHSLRELQHQFNRRVLTAALREAGVDFLDGEVENIYRLLTEADVSAGMRTQAVGRLERENVDAETVRADFISHQSVHNHLRNCLNAEKGASETDPVESTRTTVGALETRTEKIATNNLEQLAGDRIALEEFDVIVTTHVTCDECGRRHEITSLLEDGGCTCRKAGGER